VWLESVKSLLEVWDWELLALVRLLLEAWGEVWLESVKSLFWVWDWELLELVRLLLEALDEVWLEVSDEELLAGVKLLGWALWGWAKLSFEVKVGELPGWVAVLQEQLG